MVHFILGRSGSGKTEKIHEYIRKLPKDKRAVLIVPEQSSFQNEKKILDGMGAKRARNIEVLSFKRLCDNIFDNYKGITEQRIDDGVKAVLMSMAIENAPAEGGELELYGTGTRSLKKTMDLVEPMLVAVNEYKMCLITPERINEIAATVENKVLAAKLRDSARIYAAYNALLENTYADPDDDLTKLYDILGENDCFGGTAVFIDSFSGFSAQEIKIIERIFAQADEVYISICCDKSTLTNKNSIFAEPNDTYIRLLRSAKKTGKQCSIEEMETEGIRYKSEAIRAIENRIFSGYRRGSSGYVQSSERVKNDGSVELYESVDIYDEIQHIAQTIFRLVHEEGFRYSDIEIIGRSLDGYKSIIAAEFPKYDIPYFLSDPEPLETKPLIRLMLSAFEAVHSGFDTETVLRLAKTGLTPLSNDETFELENYCYVWNIRGKRWREEFTMSPSGMRSEKDDEEKINKQIKYIENLRKRIMTPLLAFEEGVKNAQSGDEITVVLYELIRSMYSATKFRDFIEQLSSSEDNTTVEREASVWDTAMNILDKMYNVLKGKRVSSKDYLELLRIYIRKSPLSDIPRTLNSVTVGVAGNIRSHSPRAVFAIGAVESVFPAQVGAVGIFTDSERRLLRDEQPEDKSLPLYESIYGASLKEKMHVYATLSAPSERLFVSWYTQSLSGGSSEPSIIKRELENILDNTTIHHHTEVTADTPSDSDLFFTERQTFDICAQLWNTEGSRSDTLKKYYRSSAGYSDKAKAIGRAAAKEGFRIKDLSLVDTLYGDSLRLSSTKLDKFAACKFAYFCNFGLNAQPLRKAAMDHGLYGTAMHYIFENLLKDTGIDALMEMGEDALKNAIDEALQKYLNEIGDTAERSSRFNAMCRKIKRNALRVLLRMCEQFKTDKFRPVDFELRIGAKDDSEGIPAYEIDLPTGKKIYVTGYVDRVDTADIGEKKYIRIIDYKTGKDEFKMKNIANGIKVQMLLYLSAILKNGVEKYSDGKVLLPAGVLYVPSTAESKPVSVNNDVGISDATAEQNKNLKMRGLLLKDTDVVGAMEEGIQGKFIPAAVNKKPPNDFNSYSNVVTEEEFKDIFAYIDMCIKRMGIEIYSGNIEAMPSEGACQFCDYSSVCRFEKGSRTEKLISYEKKQALGKIQEEVKKEKEKKEDNGNE